MYSIAELQQATGATRRTIHFYVQQGILPRPAGAGPRATYDETHRLRLLAAKTLKEAGWRLDRIRTFFEQASPAAVARVVQTGAAPADDTLASWDHPPSTEASMSVAASEPLIRYRLVPGIELLVSASASERARATVERALPLIAQWFREEGQAQGS